MQVPLSRIVAGVMNWGSWGAKLSTAAMADLISACVEGGVTSFDHADIYGDYTTEGQWGAAFMHSGVRREDIQLVTKCGIMMPASARPSIDDKHYDTSKAHIVASVENSLRELKTDYIDLLLIHRPSPLMDPELIHSTVADLIAQGKILHFGVSNFTPSQMSLLSTKTDIVANQIEVSPLALQPFVDGTLDYCIQHDVQPMAWSPLAGGVLFGKIADPQLLATRARLQAVARKYDWSLDELVYSFLLHHPSHIHVVTGSSKMERIQTAVDASMKTISDSQWFEIYTAATGHEVA